jgi:hypothetical protein
MTVPGDPRSDARSTADGSGPVPGGPDGAADHVEQPDEPDDTDTAPPVSRPAVDKATLDRIFGTVLPETTRDERDVGDRGGSRGQDDWYLANRPPHHGG